MTFHSGGNRHFPVGVDMLSGEDLTAALPVLSRYLGHSSLKGTQKYLQLTAQMYPDITTRLEEQFGDLIPQMEGIHEND